MHFDENTLLLLSMAHSGRRNRNRPFGNVVHGLAIDRMCCFFLICDQKKKVDATHLKLDQLFIDLGYLGCVMNLN